MRYYVYRHIRLDINEIFYIGVGSKNLNRNHYSIESEYHRAYSKNNRNMYWKNITSKHEYIVEILIESEDHNFIKDKEIEFIKIYGRKDLKKGLLVNLTNGGDGLKGYQISNETRSKMSLAKIGKKPWNMGLKMSSEHRIKLSKSHIGITNSTKGKTYEEIYGLEKAESMKSKLKQINKDKWNGVDNNFYGKKHNNETLEKLGRAVIQYDIHGNYIQRYISLKDAANNTGSDFRLIQKVCKKIRNKHNNFIWKYEIE